jgi:diaminopimelate decarboxylase
VSGTELTTAIRAGFNTSKLVYNGNGKTITEICLAIENNVLINIDSEFDLDHIITASGIRMKKARTLLSINPDVDPKVHSYVSTGPASSKFGI